MRWKKISSFEAAVFFSIAFTIGAFLDAIGPMHMNAAGTISSPGYLIGYAFAYWIISLTIIWGLYFYFREKSTLVSFVVSMVVGILLIVAGIFLWAIIG